MNDSADQMRKSSSSWERIGEYAIRKSPHQISKAFVDGCTMYVAWRDGVPDPIAYKDNLQEAQEACEKDIQARP